jgi:hypothetical protein
VTKFRQQDLTRALKGAIAAGVQIARLEIDPSGKIVIQFGNGERAEPSDALERWMVDHAHQAEGR